MVRYEKKMLLLNASQQDGRKAKSRGGNVLPALCDVLGTLFLVVVIVLCVPLTLPPIAGYQVFDVVSGSMEPAVPVGSVVYAKQVEPSEIKVGDIVAYQDASGVVVHRVTVNRTSLGELVTKGDANNVEDFAPVPYSAVIGRVEAHLPFLGSFMSVYASPIGKAYLLMAAACGVMLIVIASAMRQRRGNGPNEPENVSLTHFHENESEIRSPAHSATSAFEARVQEKAAASRKRTGSIARKVVIAVLIVVFVGSGGVIAYVHWQYGASDALYNQAREDFTEEGDTSGKAPITVDFASLKAKNPDVVGWLYCEDTPINYPVVQGSDNDFYLSHDYAGDFNIDGAIFVDSESRFLVDSRSVIYGHHMNSGSMFASLLNWSDQDYYDEHPVMWLLTPNQTYKVILFSGHHADAYSSLYDEVRQPGDALNAYLENARSLSDFKANVLLDSQGHYIMMSTCAYLFDNDRYVLHGMLVPVGG